jgi:inward rectifier potassium channel
MRRFYDLQLVRSQSPVFALSWTAMHLIDQSSPLYGTTPDSLQSDEAEIIVILTGLDETIAQTIHARHSFVADEILWNSRFVDILSRSPDGRRIVDYKQFHAVVPEHP